MKNELLEDEIIRKNLTAPRITPADLENTIAYEAYFTAEHGIEGAMTRLQLHQRTPGEEVIAPLNQVTICVLVLKNGTKVIGVNTGPVSPSNFDAELVRKLAREQATNQIWPMLGYELRTKLTEENADA
jgi:Phage protein (N4 Gp49/phage Sf6 gene 66) family